MAPSTLRHQAHEVGQRLQADVLWIKCNTSAKKFPVLSVIDQATKYTVATLLQEKHGDRLIHGLERAWIRHFELPNAFVLMKDVVGWVNAWTTQHCGAHRSPNWVTSTGACGATAHHSSPRHWDLHGWHEDFWPLWHSPSADLCGVSTQWHSECGRLYASTVASWKNISTTRWTRPRGTQPCTPWRSRLIWTTSTTTSCSEEGADYNQTSTGFTAPIPGSDLLLQIGMIQPGLSWANILGTINSNFISSPIKQILNICIYWLHCNRYNIN